MALNAAWVTIDGPMRSVRSNPAPNPRPATNSPGYSTGVKWMSENQIAVSTSAAAAPVTLAIDRVKGQILWDRNRQALHDKITETVVVREQPA